VPAAARISPSSTPPHFWKWKEKLSAVGMLDGRPVLKTDKGE
jgi:hypothetical protein